MIMKKIWKKWQIPLMGLMGLFSDKGPQGDWYFVSVTDLMLSAASNFLGHMDQGTANIVIWF